MKLSEKDNRRHIAIIILGSSIASFFVLILGFLLFPPSSNNGLPVYPLEMLYSFEIGGALSLLAFTLLGIKLADDKQVLASAGFTMLAIAQGVSYVTLFELFGEHITLEAITKTYTITIGGTILLVPAMFLISFYTYFPSWLRYSGIIAVSPLIICNVYYMSGSRNFPLFEGLQTVGNILLSIVQILWGVWIYKQRNEVHNS